MEKAEYTSARDSYLRGSEQLSVIVLLLLLVILAVLLAGAVSVIS